MKKLIFVFGITSTVCLYSQNSIHLVSTNPAGTTTLSVINNGGSYTVTTTPSSSDVPTKFRFYNTSTTSTYTYNVLRNIKTINTQGVNTATTYFCVGATCLPPSANTLTNPNDYIVLSPGSYDAFITYFSELSTVGYSEVYYKIFNVNNPTDTLGFTIYYNPTLSVKENENIVENLNLFPLPAKDFITLTVKVIRPVNLSIFIYNILGQKVYHQNIPVLTDLSFKNTIDLSKFTSGVYFLKIDIANHSTITKKFIIE